MQELRHHVVGSIAKDVSLSLLCHNCTNSLVAFHLLLAQQLEYYYVCK